MPDKKQIRVKLKRFKFDMMDQTSTVAMIAKRGSGKSFLIRDMLFNFKHIPIGTVICRTEALNRFYRDYVPESFIHHEYRDDILEKVLKRQRLIIDKVSADTQYKDVDPHAFLLFDDMMFETGWQKSERMRDVMFNGRHSKLLTILSLQYTMGLNVSYRNNLDWIFIFKEPIQANKKRLYDNYCGMFPNQHIFDAVLDAVTHDYGCLVVHNGAHSTKLVDQVFWYRAEDRSGFPWRTCLDCFWNMGTEKEDEDDAEDDDDFSRPFVGRNQYQVNVKRLT